MGRLPASIPHAERPDEISMDPLAFLLRVRDAHGGLAVIREDGPLFSRAPECCGVVAVSGAERIRTVLGDAASFGMPVSAARRMVLPPALVNLNRGLHSMTGDEHATHRRLLSSVLSATIGSYGDTLSAVLGDATRSWRDGATFDLLDTMRDLATAMSSRALFGPGEDSARLGARLGSYFHLRREVTSPVGAVPTDGLEALRALGSTLDEALRAHVRRCRAGGGPGGIVGDLATARTASGALLEEDAVVAHANVLFISGTEPIAVALTWIVLLLSQRRALRHQIRAELAARRSTLLDDAIDEALRLVPPNALMVRVTTREVAVGDATLPEGCEVVVCPFVEHRDPVRFPGPSRYLPSRWRTVRPSPFEYLPFGAGGHACIGKALARHLLGRALAHLLVHHDLALAGDQAIDWRVHIMLMPSVDAVVVVRTPDDPDDGGGRLLGPAAELLGAVDPA